MKDLFDKENDNYNTLEYYITFNHSMSNNYKYNNNEIVFVDNDKIKIFENDKFKIALNENIIDNFNNIVNKIKMDSYNGIIPFNSIFNYNNLSIAPNYTDIITCIRNHVYNIYVEFITYNQKILNENNFFDMLKFFLSKSLQPITFSDMIKSDVIDYKNYGLSFDINFNNSQEEILNDVCFEYFYNLCLRNNFIFNYRNLNNLVYYKPNTENFSKVNDVEILMFNKIIKYLFNLFMIDNDKQQKENDYDLLFVKDLYIDCKCYYKNITNIKMINSIKLDYYVSEKKGVNFLKIFDNLKINTLLIDLT